MSCNSVSRVAATVYMDTHKRPDCDLQSSHLLKQHVCDVHMMHTCIFSVHCIVQQCVHCPVRWKWWWRCVGRHEQHKQLWRLVKNCSENITKILSGHGTRLFDTLLPVYAFSVGISCHFIFLACKDAHTAADTHTHTCTYWEINAGLHPLIRSIKLSFQWTGCHYCAKYSANVHMLCSLYCKGHSWHAGI